MKKNLKKFLYSRTFYVLLTVFLLGGVAIAGVVSLRRSNPASEPEEPAKVVQQPTEAEVPSRAAEHQETETQPEQAAKHTTEAAEENFGQRTADHIEVTEPAGEEQEETREEVPVGEDPGEEGALIFNKEEGLIWPVEGRLIREFSMDTTVYYPTLDLYKTSAGIVLQAEPGMEVKAAAAGRVREIAENEEIGHYMILELGEGYELTYGLLQETDCEVGDSFEQGEVIGTAAEPTIYYTLEGPCIYFAMTKDEKPVDPLSFMDLTE